MVRIFLAALLSALMLPSAAAQEEEGGFFALGLGAGYSVEPYAELEDAGNAIIVPAVIYSKGAVTFAGKELSIALKGDDRLSLSGLLDVRFQGYKADDSPVLIGMDDRKSTLEAGLALRSRLGPWNLSLKGLADVLSAHGGYEIEARAGYRVLDSRITQVTPFVGVAYASADLADYYFGVEPDEAIVNEGPGGFSRGAYVVGDTLTPIVGLSARQALSRRLAVFGAARVQILPEAVTDSPIVDKDTQAGLFVGITRIF